MASDPRNPQPRHGARVGDASRPNARKCLQEKEEGRGAFPVTVGIPGPIASRERLPGLDLPVCPLDAGQQLVAFAVPAPNGSSTSKNSAFIRLLRRPVC